MMLLLQAAPLMALVALLASGRAGPVWSCLAAMALTLPPLLLAGRPALAPFALASAVQGLWLAVVPVGIIAGGLVFHQAVVRPPAEAQPSGTGDVPDALFTAAFLLGPFTETVTGFGVGTVFALGAIRAAGVSGVPAALIALIAQTLIPWGGLGPGTAIGAALAGIPAQALATRSAWQTAALLLLLLPAFWHWCALAGHRVQRRQRVAQTLWVLATGGLLVGLHHAVPWEVCGLLATGLVLAARQMHAHPPRDAASRARALRAAFPYALLALVLLGSRLWRDAPALQPFADLPALPANHAMVALWLVALGLLAARAGAPAALLGALRAALGRARRPAIALLMFVLLSRFLSNAGIPQALAFALSAGFGAAAPFAAPLLAGFAGFFAGTNVGANSAMMPLQAALGRLAGLGPAVLPAVQNGTPFLLLSPQLTSIAASLAGDTASPARIWRHAWPVALAALVVGMASVALG